jgi:hypothetical protein
MSRLFVELIRALAVRGVTMHLGTFSDLEQINAAKLDSWRPLMPSFSPSAGGARDDDGFALFAHNHRGEIIATQAARIFEWPDTNLKKEAKSLRLFYSDPALARDGESCEVTAPIAKSVKGRVGLGGAIWVDKSFQGRQLSDLIPRMTRAFAHATYGTDQHIGLVSPENAARKLHLRHGFREHSEFLTLRNSRSYPGKDVPMTLLRMHASGIADDAYLHITHWRSKID